MLQVGLVSFFGVLGVLSRYAISVGVTRLAGAGFPLATMLINVVGSFFIGLVYVAGADRALLSEAMRVGLMVGFMGGFTTFSSFSFETVALLESGKWMLGALNVAGSVGLCLGATALGMSLARA